VATYSNYLGLKLNAPTDPFLLSDFISNWSILDANPGIFICTSATRPAYSSNQAGRLIFCTDLKQFQWWNGSSWQTDALYAPPVFHGGVYLNAGMSRNSNPTFNICSLSISRPCSMAVIVTAEYSIGPRTYQELYQSITFDGQQQVTAFREHSVISAENITGHAAYVALTSCVALESVAAGSHTVGILVQVQSMTSSSVTIDGAKTVAMVSNYSLSNAF
jgi:hypothetical protein